jgi:CDP-6-deoxy-D-xylo-4-hexulose-3-dehydrase
MGYNLKPLDLQGAIGIEQLKKFDEIETNRKVSKNTLEKIFTDNIEGVSAVKTLEKSDVSWFGTPFICDNYELKSRLVEFLEENKIQTRNYFAGNILIHPGYKFLDDYTKYPEANKVLDKVFFIGASPHYNEEIFNYIESVVKNFR